jgi:hemin uptake protein HemP
MNDSPPVPRPPLPQPCDSATTAPTAEARAAWRSEELLGERTEVLILHQGEVYRLRRTRQGKLILCK